MIIRHKSATNFLVFSLLAPFTAANAEVDDATGSFDVSLTVPECRFAAGEAGSKTLFQATLQTQSVFNETKWIPNTDYTSQITFTYEFDLEDISACAGFEFSPAIQATSPSPSITGMDIVDVTVDETTITVPSSLEGPIDFLVTLSMTSGTTRPTSDIENESVSFTIETATTEP